MALSSFRPLRSRNFALVWSAALVSNVGSWMQTVALGFVITARTHNPLWTGLVAAAAFLPMGLLAPLGGALADRLDRRRWLIVTTVAEACFAAALAVLAATGHAQPAVLVGDGSLAVKRRSEECGQDAKKKHASERPQQPPLPAIQADAADHSSSEHVEDYVVS